MVEGEDASICFRRFLLILKIGVLIIPRKMHHRKLLKSYYLFVMKFRMTSEANYSFLADVLI